MGKIVKISDYNPQWIEKFKFESKLIKQALGDNLVAIYHIGSTSIPGMSAKPIIDIIPVVKDILAVNNQGLEALGYRARGELGMLFRRHFSREDDVHLHRYGIK